MNILLYWIAELIQKVLKNTLAKENTGPQYVCNLVAQIKYDQPQEQQIVDFSKYNDLGIVYTCLCLEESADEDIEYYTKKCGIKIDQELLEQPTIFYNVELFQNKEGLWKWRRLQL